MNNLIQLFFIIIILCGCYKINNISKQNNYDFNISDYSEYIETFVKHNNVKVDSINQHLLYIIDTTEKDKNIILNNEQKYNIQKFLIDLNDSLSINHFIYNVKYMIINKTNSQRMGNPTYISYVKKLNIIGNNWSSYYTPANAVNIIITFKSKKNNEGQSQVVEKFPMLRVFTVYDYEKYIIETEIIYDLTIPELQKEIIKDNFIKI